MIGGKVVLLRQRRGYNASAPSSFLPRAVCHGLATERAFFWAKPGTASAAQRKKNR